MDPSRSQIFGEPGPAVTTDSADLSDAIELEFFRSLPEVDLRSLYPAGITPPVNLGPVTPYDRYDQFHQAILHLAAGVSLPDVVRAGNFEIDENQFVKHMAIYCAQSLQYTDRDLSRLRGKLLGTSCTHVPGEQYCMSCSRIEFISMLKTRAKQMDAYSSNKMTARGKDQGRVGEEKGTHTAEQKSARSILFDGSLALFWKFVLPLVAIGFLYESHMRPFFTNSGELRQPILRIQEQTLTVDWKAEVLVQEVPFSLDDFPRSELGEAISGRVRGAGELKDKEDDASTEHDKEEDSVETEADEVFAHPEAPKQCRCAFSVTRTFF